MTLLGEGDPGPTSAMEDGSELRLEVMRGRKECGKPWSVPPFYLFSSMVVDTV